MLADTIAAISTPPGEGGIGIVRISGDEAIRILNRVFRPRFPKNWDQVPGFSMHLGQIVEKNGHIIDEVLVSLMRSPKSFTGENVVEINCHGGFMPLQRTLETVLNAGARLAEPGEFSKRAFLNGRIDLTQAEAIIDLIRAKSEISLNAAVHQLDGALARKIAELRKELLAMLAGIEAAIDFPEEHLDEITLEEIGRVGQEVDREITRLVKTAEQGKFIREGINTVIVGRTNVGKSSLLNALLRENRSIVTEIPGTTRDTIEEFINIGGFPLKIIDTAGIRDTADVVERMGVERTREILKDADLVLLVLDVTEGMTGEDESLLEEVRNKKTVVIINKIDTEIDPGRKEKIEKYLAGRPYLYISAKEELGLDRLEEMIARMIMEGGIAASRDLLMVNLRHKENLLRASRHLQDLLQAREAGVSVDFLAIDLRNAWEALGEITGETAGEELLDRIFSGFCLGK